MSSSSDSYTPPQPHPYQLAAYNSPVQSDSPAISYHSRPLEPDKPPESITHQQQQRRPQRSSLLAQSYYHLPNKFTLFLIFLPIPPLLSLLYIVTGHAILLHHHAPYSAPFSSSAKAGLVGGTILSVPLDLLLYLLLFPTSKPELPEDFFEDDDDDEGGVGTSRWAWYAGLGTVIVLVLCIGGAAGPLGVTCLSSSEGEKMFMSPGEAAAAGMVGGLVLAFGSVTVVAVGLVCCAIWLRRTSSRS